MQTHATAMDGPEFLAAVASQNEANGLAINADVFQSRAREWHLDKITIRTLGEQLQAANDRLDEVRRAALVV